MEPMTVDMGRPNELLSRLHIASVAAIDVNLTPMEAQILYNYIRWLETEEWLADPLDVDPADPPESETERYNRELRG